MSNVQTKIDYEYKVSGAAQAANEMTKVGEGAGKAADGLGDAKTMSAETADGLGTLIVKFVSLAAAIAAARKVVALFTGTVSAAVDANEDMNKFLVVMGDNASMVNFELETLADNTNRNVFELRSLAGGLQDMLVPMGVARGEAAQMSTDFVQLATDMSSFNNVPVAETLAAIQSALAGQSRPLRRFGVDTRVAALEAQALSMGIDGSWQSMDQATQANVLYAKVVADTADAQGDAARTADEAANVLVGFEAAIEEGKVAIGDEFLPVIEALVPMLRDELGGALPILQEIAEKIATDALRYGPIFIKVLGTVIDVVEFTVEHLDKLEQAARLIGGPGVWLAAETIEYFGDKNLEAAEEVDWLSNSIEYILAPMNQYLDSLNVGIEYAADLGDQVNTLTNFTKDLTREQIAAAMATIELNRAEVQRSADLKGGVTPGIREHLHELDEYVLRLKDLASTLGSQPDSASGAGAGRVQAQREVIELLNEETLLEESLAMKQLAALEAESQLKDAMFEKNMQRRQMEMEQVQAQMEPLISAAQRSTDIIVSGLFGGFDSIKNGFKNMLEDLATEWIKSKVFSLILGGGAKVATGGAGFFL